ncbi:protein-glutamate methylesterase/protein-glutamine glutaminase [Paenibacillus fonticola]|uniref:protein-glutamate methylesterase/protein-glutamine glutaminase n=1 Tax=Paenibacillus fonticola TaxID=379896 RepID=UPI000366D799|nr:chemotaxis response regulator protein-glutamate methylesterase [Paenibacillus fonticola]
MPYRIMVVDDSAFMRKIVSDLIEQNPSCEVIATARNGREAIEQIALLSPDLVTLDVEMPEMNGLDALKIIMERHPVPVIMLSGINEQGMRETIMALELGAFDFIRKPSASTSSHDIAQVRRELHEQIQAAMLMKEHKAARQLALDNSVNQHARSPNLNKSARPANAETTKSSHKPTPGTPGTLRPGAKSGAAKAYAASASEVLSKNEGAKAEASDRTKLNSAHLQKKTGPYVHVPDGADRLNRPLLPDKLANPALIHKKNNGSIMKRPKADEKIEAAAIQQRLPVKEKNSGLPLKTDFTDLVAIGTSTGGPKALKAVLEKIPRNFPAPIVIVQHMPPNFTKSLAQRLNSLSALHVVEAEEGMKLLPGTAYIAPGGHHMNVVKDLDGYKVTLTGQEPRNGHRPSVDVMYESLMPLKALKRHIVLLTGMGSDGARAMKKLYDAGVSSTIAESEETCVVYGMPRSAIELNCVSHVLPLHEIGPKLVQVVK